MREGISMQGWLPRDIWSDARHYQIAALSTLVIYNFGWLDFGARPLNSALALTSTILTQIYARASTACRASTCARR
jgi:hypothetical protein